MTWDEGKIRRFVEDWNEMLDIPAIRERYRISNPWVKANQLRALGHALKPRDKKGISRAFKSRPEDTHAAWTNRTREECREAGRKRHLPKGA